MTITSYKNNSPLQAWISIALGLFFIILVYYHDPVGLNPDSGLFDFGSSGTRKLIQIFGGFFIAGGIFNLIWSPKRIVRIDTGLRWVVIRDNSRFGQKRRIIPFTSVAEVSVDEWKNPDSANLFDQYEYWLSLNLLTGESIEISDRSPYKDRIAKMRADVIANMQ